MDIQKMTTRLLYVLFIISAVVILGFFLIGFGNAWEENPTMNNPLLTDALIWWNIVLCVACFGIMIWSFVKYVKEYGFNKSYLYTWGLPIATVVIGLIVGIINKDESLLINGKNQADPFDNILTDTCMVSIAILLVISVAALIYSLYLSSKKK